MTPIQLKLRPSTTDPVCKAQPEEASVCRLPDPQPDPSLQVCRADTFSTATPHGSSRSEQFRNRYAQQVARHRLENRILNTTRQRAAKNQPGAVVLGPDLLAGCTHPPIQENGGGGPVGNPDPDRPPQNTSGADGGLGAGIVTTFATSVCTRPLDMDPSATASSALVTCGEDGLNGNTSGIGVVERIDANSGAKTILQLPIILNGDANRSVYYTASAPGSNGIVYTGFSPRNTEAQLRANGALFSNSGVLTWNEGNPSAATFITFDRMQSIIGGVPKILLENGHTVSDIRPNSPVSITRVGDLVFVLSENQVFEPNLPATNAPGTVHRFSIEANGTLKAAPVAGVQPNVIFGTNDPTNAILLPGYHPTAIENVGDGRFAVAIQGSTGATNPSSLFVTTTNFGLGFNVDPNAIPLIDANKPGAPDFVINNSSQMSIIDINSVPYALVGSADGSGRIALVNLDRNHVENRVRFFNVFDDDGNNFSDHGDIANIVARPGFAYAIANIGEIRTVTPSTGAFSPNIYDITPSNLLFGSQLPALIVGGSTILVARSGAVSKGPIN